MKKLDSILKEYMGRLNVDTLKYLAIRLEDRVSGDLAEALDVVSKNSEIDKWLRSAETCDEFYDLVDTLQEYVCRELNKRAPDMQQ